MKINLSLLFTIHNSSLLTIQIETASRQTVPLLAPNGWQFVSWLSPEINKIRLFFWRHTSCYSFLGNCLLTLYETTLLHSWPLPFRIRLLPCPPTRRACPPPYCPPSQRYERTQKQQFPKTSQWLGFPIPIRFAAYVSNLISPQR